MPRWRRASRAGCLFYWLLTQLLVQQRRVIVTELFDTCAIRLHIFLDFLHMIEVVSESAMNVGEGEVLMPDDDVLHAHAVAGNSLGRRHGTGR